MKYNVKTGEVEGSAEEIAKLIGMKEKADPEPEKERYEPEKVEVAYQLEPEPSVVTKVVDKVVCRNNTIGQKRNRQRTIWTAEEDKLLKELYDKGKPRAHIARKLKRTIASVVVRACNTGIAKNAPAINRQKKGQYMIRRKSSAFNDFCRDRIKSLTAQGVHPNDAMKIAANDYNRGKEKLKGTTAEFPKFESVNEQYTDLLKDIVKHCSEKNGILTLKQDGYCFGIERWSHWRKFMAEFLTKSSIISDALGIKNRWKQVDTYLVYGGAHYDYTK